MTIALSTIGSRGVALAVGPSAPEEVGDGFVLELTLHDGPLVLNLSLDASRALAAELPDQLAPIREVP
jgi:hypothetical protein